MSSSNLASSYRLCVISLFALAAPFSLAAPQVGSLSESPVPCTGYMEIAGTAFGTTPGQLLVNGMAAPVAEWSDTEIVGYVPVGVPSGPAELTVSNASGASDPFAIQIADCVPIDGKLLWRQRFDVSYNHARPIVGFDGTIYVMDLSYRLYALTPDGRVKWIVDGSLPAQIEPGSPIFGNTSVDVDDAGNLYSAHKWHVTSMNPDGTLRWRFDIDQSQRSYIVYDTKVGPDGNVYAAASHTPSATNALGVYSLTPDGTLRWNVAHPYDRTTRKQIDLVFGPGDGGQQLYFSANQNSYALDLGDGDVIFDNLLQVTGFAAVSPVDDTVHSTNYAYEPDGTIAWQSAVFLNGAMTIDSQGIHYATTSMFPPRIVALETNGATRYETQLDLPSGTSPDTTTISPDDALLYTHDIANRLLVLNSASGAEEWRIELGPEGVSAALPQGRPQYWQRRPAFSSDGATTYYLAAVNSAGQIRSRAFIYAIRPGGTAQAPNLAVSLGMVSPSTDGNESAILNFSDPNSQFHVTGYNVYRSSDPTSPPGSWQVVALDAVDEDPATPNIQWTDASGTVSPSGVWHYQVTAYNSELGAEGPF